jgi:hypothetical protein
LVENELILHQLPVFLQITRAGHKSAKISGPLILQEGKTAKISGPLLLHDGKSAKISGPLITKEGKAAKV